MTPTSIATSGPSVSPSPASKGAILNDTSLASVITGEGNRHIFFQDTNGNIRHNVFVASSPAGSSWETEADHVFTDVLPKNQTPIAALSPSSSPVLTQIFVFFISTENLLAAVTYSSDPNLVDSTNLMNNSFPVAAGSRTLSITPVEVDRKDTFDYSALLFFEAVNGNITILQGAYNSTSMQPNDAWQWQNISEIIYAPLRGTGTWLSPPLGATCDSTLVAPMCSLRIKFFNTQALSNLTAMPLSYLDFDRWTGPCEPHCLSFCFQLQCYIC